LLDGLSPNLLALIAAFFIAVARLLFRAGLDRLDPVVTTTVTSLVSVLSACGFYYLLGGVEQWPLTGLLWFVGVGLAGGLSGRYFSLVSIKLIGLARTSVVIQTSLVWSAVMAVVFLDERMTLGVALGTMGIMCGTIFLAFERLETRERIPPKYYLVPLLSALTFALSHALRKHGLSVLPSAPLGMGISNGVALFFMAAALSFPKRETPRSWERRPLLIVVAAGVFNALADFFFWSAVKGGEVVKVIPINRLSVLMVIFFSWLFFRRQEMVTLRVVVGGVLSVAGAIAIVAGK